MTTPPDRDPRRLQFTLRFVLVVMTAACLMLGILQWLLPSDLPIAAKIVTRAAMLASLAFAAWTFVRVPQNPWRTPSDYVTVKVDARWERRVKSPIVMGPIASLTGVSLTFAPLTLLWCGQVEKYGLLEWILVPLCLLTIYFVPGFYMRLAFEVIAELLKAGQSEGPLDRTSQSEPAHS